MKGKFAFSQFVFVHKGYVRDVTSMNFGGEAEVDLQRPIVPGPFCPAKWQIFKVGVGE